MPNWTKKNTKHENIYICREKSSAIEGKGQSIIENGMYWSGLEYKYNGNPMNVLTTFTYKSRQAITTSHNYKHLGTK